MEIHDYVNTLIGERERCWPKWLAWAVFVTALIYMGLMFTVPDPTPIKTIPIRLVYPLIMMCPVVIFFVAGAELRGQHRWAWYFQGIAIILGAIIPELMQIDAYINHLPPPDIKNTLYILAYGAAITAGALYLTQKVGWEGNTARMFLDSLMAGYASLVCMQMVLPSLASWPWTENAASGMYLLAFDAGILFVVAVMAARYGKGGGYLLVMTLFCFLSLFLADVLNLLIQWMPGGTDWEFIVYPLYIIHSTSLAHGAYQSIRNPPRISNENINVMPMAEWLLWTKLPRVLVLLSIIAVIFNPAHRGISSDFWILIGLSIVREVLVARDDRRVLRELHMAKERANEAETQTKNFLDRVIHDLAAPLHSLQTSIRRLQINESVSSRIGEHYEQLEHLVHQLREYQKARYHRITAIKLNALDITPVCFSAIDSIQDKAEAEGIDVLIDISQDKTHVIGDGMSIRRIFDNLLNNALNATSEGGIITITTRPSGSRLRIEVKDTGCGIPSHKQAKIFSPMVRFSSGGTGLGLAICQELVQAMRGEIGVISDEQKGSTFWFELPMPLANSIFSVDQAISEGEGAKYANSSRH